MRRLPPLLTLTALSIFTLAPARAQVEARQGTAPAPDVIAFASPMILDLALPNIAAVEPGSQLQLPKVGKYICDNDVRLLNLAIEKQLKGPRRSRSLELVVSGAILVSDSYDRRVDIALRLKSGDQILSSQMLRNLSAEEERSTPFRLILPVAQSSLLTAFSSQPSPVLELTLTVRDDS